ncbi:MAG: efflux RND transporter permease subunit, partial [Planctomycetota bacterium]
VQQRDEGKSVRDAAIEAARLRFRPILMTAFSFILGTLPLLIASGAGAQSRRVLGTTVVSGMTLATVIGVILVPVFYFAIQSTVEKIRPVAAGGTADDEPSISSKPPAEDNDDSAPDSKPDPAPEAADADGPNDHKPDPAP